MDIEGYIKAARIVSEKSSSIKALADSFRKLKQPKDFYDLDFLLQVYGFNDEASKVICDFIDSFGRTELQVRKTIGKIANRGEMTKQDYTFLLDRAPHIFANAEKVYKATSKIDRAGCFMADLNILAYEASTQHR